MDEPTIEAVFGAVEATKTEAGVQFPAGDYAYVPDAATPSTWKLRMTATPGGPMDPIHVGAACAAISPGGWRGQRADIPPGDLAAVKAKLRAAWRKAFPDRPASEMPAHIREAELPPGEHVVELLSEVGRKLSAANEAGLRAAVKALTTILAQLGDEPQQESADVQLVGELVPLIERTSEPDGTRRVKVIAPGWGSSGYYSPDVLRRDGPRVLKAGTRMFWDHPSASEESDRPERSLRDLAAVLVEDAKFDANHPAGPGLYSRAKVFGPYEAPVDELAPHIGVSIRGVGKGTTGEADGRAGRVIEQLVSIDSVDFVTTPGAGGKVLELFEAARGQQQQDNGKEGDDMTTKLDEQLSEARAETARTREALIALQCERRVDELLRDVNLPEPTLRRVAEQLVRRPPIKDNALDETALKAAVEAAVKSEAEYLTAAGVGRIVGFGTTNDGGGEVKEADLEAAFVGMGLSESAAKRAARGRV